MVFCTVRQALIPKISAIVEAIEDGSLYVFSTAHRRCAGRDYPLAICVNCPILAKHQRGESADYTDCRFFMLFYLQDETET